MKACIIGKDSLPFSTDIIIVLREIVNQYAAIVGVKFLRDFFGTAVNSAFDSGATQFTATEEHISKHLEKFQNAP